MAKRTPTFNEATPVSLINLDPAAAARSIDAAVSAKNNEKDWLDEKVQVQFYNIEEPGNKAFFCFGDCQNPTSFEIEHGEIKELTRGVIRFIESRQTPIYAYKPNGSGKMVKTLMGWNPRFQCRQVYNRGGL